MRFNNNDSLKESYNQVPYPSSSFLITHPNRLATIASLLGMSPAPVEGCRVLELGCASGGNIIPMGYSLPESEFVGIDFARRQTERARETIEAVGLSNVRIEHRDMLEIGPDFGQFDYIIAHGIYSWVAGPVRDKILAICGQNLKPNGVAYVSYNAYPGYAMFEVVREMMLYHTRHTTEPLERVAAARAFMETLAQSIPAEDHYGSFIKGYVEVRMNPDSERYPGEEALLHDEFEVENKAVYFHQFVEHAAQHDLQYLGEARFTTMTGSQLPAEVLQSIGKLSKNIIDFEQYLDFFKNHLFRETLLCRAGIPLTWSIEPAAFKQLYVAAPCKTEAQTPNLNDVSVEKFKAVDGATFSTDHPITKAALTYLIEIWPQVIHFDTLIVAARSLLASSGLSGQAEGAAPAEGTVDDRALLAANLLKAYGYSEKLVELHSFRPPFTTNISERPVASALARYHARQGEVKVTNLRHNRVELDQLEQYILLNADGQHDRTALLEKLVDLVKEGTLQLSQEAQPVTDPEQVKPILTNMLNEGLYNLAQMALLIG